MTDTPTPTITPTPYYYTEMLTPAGNDAYIAREITMGDYVSIILIGAILFSIWIMLWDQRRTRQ